MIQDSPFELWNLIANWMIAAATIATLIWATNRAQKESGRADEAEKRFREQVAAEALRNEAASDERRASAAIERASRQALAVFPFFWQNQMDHHLPYRVVESKADCLTDGITYSSFKTCSEVQSWDASRHWSFRRSLVPIVGSQSSSASVFAAAEDHPVEVTRRDGEDLVLMSKSEADARQRLVYFAGQLIAAVTTDGGSLAERMADKFPWMLALSVADRELCAKSFSKLRTRLSQPDRYTSLSLNSRRGKRRLSLLPRDWASRRSSGLPSMSRWSARNGGPRR